MRERKTKKIDELANQILESMGLYQRYKEQEVYAVWSEVVGNMIASRTQEIKVFEGKLFVKFSSAVVRNEILMVKEGVIQALNDRVGRRVIEEMIIR